MYRLPHCAVSYLQRCSLSLRFCAVNASTVAATTTTATEASSNKQNTSASAASPQVSKPHAVDPKLESLAASYAQLTLKQLSDLQRLIFKKMGHSDDFYEKALLRSLGGGGGGGGSGAGGANPMMTMMMGGANNAGVNGAAALGNGNNGANGCATAEKVEKKKVEKNTYDVKLGPYAPEIKIKLIKQLRAVTSMTIADAKKAVEKCPGLVATNMAKSDAEKLKELFVKLGATVELL